MKTIPFARPIIDEAEKQAVSEILSGHILVHGPKTTEFEKAFCDWTGAKYGTSVASCTAGLHLAYFSRGIGPGDEVIVPAMTHVATGHAVELVGATPVFVDAEIRTGNIDLDRIEDAITERTRAISLVHYLGMPVDMDRINAIAKKHDLYVVEDCALAIGTYYKGVHAGLLGDIGCFSFYPVKHMTTAEGGMVLSKHEGLVGDVALQKAFGVDRSHGQRKVPGQYDVPMLGFNYRMNEIEAALGIEQVERLDAFLSARKANYEALSRGLAEIGEVDLLESSSGDFVSSHYCHCIILKEPLAGRRVDVIEGLKARGVGTSIYYPKPVPMLTYYCKKYGFKEKQFPVAERLAYHSIALPVGPHLEPGDTEMIVDNLKDVIQEVSS